MNVPDDHLGLPRTRPERKAPPVILSKSTGAIWRAVVYVVIFFLCLIGLVI
jgi:hypothetical protein